MYFCRLYKGGEIQASEVQQIRDITSATARIEIESSDNRAEITCQVNHPASNTPLTVTSKLTVLCKFFFH